MWQSRIWVIKQLGVTPAAEDSGYSRVLWSCDVASMMRRAQGRVDVIDEAWVEAWVLPFRVGSC